MHNSIHPSDCTGRKRAFDWIRPSQTQHCEFVVYLRKVDTISIDNNKQKLHWQCFIIII
jgi:hypothetical protein